MVKKGYEYIIEESFKVDNTSGLRGDIHIRPLPGQGEDYHPSFHVSCSKRLSDTSGFPVGTKFKILAKKRDSRPGDRDSIYSNPKWEFEVISE